MKAIQCQQCDSKCIVKDHAIICTECGYEVTPELHFAELMADAILCQKRDGVDRSKHLATLATCYELTK